MFARQCKWLFVGHVRFRYACVRFRSSACTNPNLDNHIAHAHLNFLINKLELPTSQAEDFLKKHKNVPDISPERLGRAVEMLLDLGFERAEIRECPEVILLMPFTIKQRTMLLQEAGVRKVTPRCLVSYLLLAKKRVSLLKAYRLIPGEVDVARSMLGHLGEGPGPLLQSPRDDATLTATQMAVVRHFLIWRLELSHAEVDRLLKMYTRIRNKSVRLISLTLDILEHQLGFSHDKIKNNGFLIHSHPDNTLRTLREVPHIRGVPYKNIVLMHPKIVMSPTDTILCTLRHLEEYGIVDEAVRRNPEVFTLGSESVRARLEEIHALPELSGLQGHPRVLRLVQYLHKARARLSTLQDLRVRCASLHVLCGTKARFERYTQDGVDRTRGRDVVHYLSNVLGHEGKEIRAQLRRHPYWCNVPLQAIKLTCECLLEQGYSTDDIFYGVHLLLYSRDKVCEQLQQLWDRPELQSDVFRAAQGHADPPRAHHLALCLYFIERDYHFTGDGVWEGLPHESAIADSIG